GYVFPSLPSSGSPRAESFPHDGDWLSRTQEAFLYFQRENGLKVDGICGPLSWGKLSARGDPEEGNEGNT
ncbi:hypothetical protein GH141_08685, partial [bacterium]|nr:hypothetical protein [bacterium]